MEQEKEMKKHVIIRKARLAKGITLSYVAYELEKKIKSKVTDHYLTKFESGKMQLSDEAVKHIAKIILEYKP